MNQSKGNISNPSLNDDFFFIMRKIGHSDRTRLIKADFSPLVQICSGTTVNTFPTFNMDKKSHMPSFILPVDIKQYEKQQDQYVNMHLKKILQASEERKQILVPKPSKRNSCCCICKLVYEDYLTHINIQKHQLALRLSEFNKDINQLCELFSDRKRILSSEFSTDQQDLNQIPRKKRKYNKKQSVKNKNNLQTVVSSNQLQVININQRKQIFPILA